MILCEVIAGLELAQQKFGPEHHIEAHEGKLLLCPEDPFSEDERIMLQECGWHFNKNDGWFCFT